MIVRLWLRRHMWLCSVASTLAAAVSALLLGFVLAGFPMSRAQMAALAAMQPADCLIIQWLMSEAGVFRDLLADELRPDVPE